MKKITFLLTLMLLTLGIGNAWAETVTMTAGTNGSACTVNGIDGIKVGTSSKGGDMTITVPAGATSLQLYAAAWKGVSGLSINITPTTNVSPTSISLTADNGITSNSPFTLSGNAESFKHEIALSNITSTTTLTLASSTTKRFVVWGATCTIASGETPEPEPDPTPDPGTSGETTTVTYVFKDDPSCPANATDWLSGTIDQYTGWTATKGGSNNPKYYTTGTGLRVYNGGKFTITSTKVMLDITLTFSGTSYTFSDENTTNPQTVTPNAKSYEWSVGKTCRLQKIEITYAAEASGEPENPTPSVSVTPASYTFATTNVGETATQEFTITAENTTATLSASIDNTTDFAISAITGDKVTVTYQPQSAGDHTATMTVKAGEEASTTVALTGKAVAALEGTWILVTDASSLKAGDEIIIAAKESDVALSTTQASNNRPEVAITKNDNTITATSETQVLTLQAGNKENTLALYTGDGYLYAASSGSNWLRTETTLSDNSSWSIAVAADGTATLIAQGTNTRNTLYYNKNSKIFSCYSNTQQEIAIYKKTNGQQLAGLAYATTKHLTKLGDAFTTPTLTNPNSLTVTYNSSDNNVATVDNTGALTIKAAGVVTITATFAGDASYLEGSAKYTLCVTEHAGTEADPYSVADARRVIDVMETAEGVYATGIVSEIVTAYNATFGNITYNISIDGTTAADQLQAYRGKGVNGENFSSANDIKVGDEVVVKGNLKKYETTYEFDADNQLVSLKREKQQAGLAYEEKEHTANVGEDFTEPTLTNPNSLTVTYSSSNTALATVDATTGEVSILAVGKVTITASSAADATYAAGSASYNITITDPSLAVATLPFYFDGKKADIEGTAGMTQEGIDSDYNSAPYLKFNTAGDWAIVQFDSEPGEFSFLLKQNGQNAGTFTVYESANGENYTPIWSGGDLGGNGQSATIEPTLSATARYVKFEYTTKGASTNYGLGSISIQKADHRAEAGIAWNPATISLTVGDAFTAPTFNNPNGLSGITFASSNETLATVDNAGAITLVSGKTGTATITATFADGHADYKPAEATCVITVSPKSEKVVILAQYNGQWYALKAAYLSGKTDRLDAIPVNYVGGKLYNVAEADKASIEWSSVVEGDKVSFINDGKYLKGKTTTTLLFEEDADGLYQWDNTTYTMTIGTSVRSFLYNGEAFRNFAVSNAGKVVNDVLYSSLPVVTAPVYETGTLYTITATAENGTVTGAGVYVAGDKVTLTADPAMDYTFVNWTVGGAEVSTANPFVFEATENLDLVANFAEISQTSTDLTGTFSVGEYEVAQFATGNLQYNVKNKEWSFAKQQYQYIGDANINVGDPTFTGTIDMFGWSNGDANNFGVNPSCSKDNYTGTFVDWGTLFPAEDNWSTLSHEQWDYLLNKRGAGKKQIARVGTIFGVMLFPDVWNAPLTVEAQYDNYFKVNIYNYDFDQWAELEEAGAVFLPAAGRRFGGYGNTINYDGTTDLGEEYKLQYCTNDLAAYWTSTKHNDGERVSYLLNLGNKGAKYSTLELGWYEYGHVGQSVRLAKVTKYYTRAVTPGNLGTICLPFNVPAGKASGATFYTLAGKDANGRVAFDVVTGELEAGKSYLFQATATEIVCFYGTESVLTPDHTGAMKGTFVDLELTELSNIYYFAKNALWSCEGDTKLEVPANRAYVNMLQVADSTEAAPVGVRRITLGVNGQNTATGVENIGTSEQPMKMIIDGQLYIIRGEKMYDAQGKLVK